MTAGILALQFQLLIGVPQLFRSLGLVNSAAQDSQLEWLSFVTLLGKFASNLGPAHGDDLI
jgi:hypothetical protein